MDDADWCPVTWSVGFCFADWIGGSADSYAPRKALQRTSNSAIFRNGNAEGICGFSIFLCATDRPNAAAFDYCTTEGRGALAESVFGVGRSSFSYGFYGRPGLNRFLLLVIMRSNIDGFTGARAARADRLLANDSVLG